MSSGPTICENMLGAGTGDRPQIAAVAFGGFAAALTTATAADILTLGRDGLRLKVVNTCNVDMVVTLRLPGQASASNVDLDAYTTATATMEDLATNYRKLPSGTVLAAYARLGVAPASGEVRLSVY